MLWHFNIQMKHLYWKLISLCFCAAGSAIKKIKS